MSTISQNFASPEGEGFPPSPMETLKRSTYSMKKLVVFETAAFGMGLFPILIEKTPWA
jgi:hypothetical protein